MNNVTTITNPLIESMRKTFAGILETIKKKNADYANSDEVFRNFKAAPSILTGVSVEKGILVRLTDKIVRIDNLLDKEPAVTGESMLDSIDDAIGYLGILKAYRETLAPKEPAAGAKVIDISQSNSYQVGGGLVVNVDAVSRKCVPLPEVPKKWAN